MHRSTLSVLAIAAVASAQRPTNTSICNFYTQALFTENTAANQFALVSAVVNRAAIGNTTSTPVVNGIVVPGTFNDEEIDLSVYFTGAFNSTNRGGSSGESVNFLDGGGAEPLMMGMAANSSETEQFVLFNHLYTYFGALLGCSQYGMEGYPEYDGDASMFEAHKFMGLDENEVGYFIQQVGLSALSFGVTEADATAVGETLTAAFNVRCAPAVTLIPAQGSQLQSICIRESCPVAPNATCGEYPAQPLPIDVSMSGGSMPGGSGNTTMTGGMGTRTSGTPSATMSSAPSTQPTGAGSSLAVGGVLGAAMLAIAL